MAEGQAFCSGCPPGVRPRQGQCHSGAGADLSLQSLEGTGSLAGEEEEEEQDRSLRLCCPSGWQACEEPCCPPSPSVVPSPSHPMHLLSSSVSRFLQNALPLDQNITLAVHSPQLPALSPCGCTPLPSQAVFPRRAKATAFSLCPHFPPFDPLSGLEPSDLGVASRALEEALLQ